MTSGPQRRTVLRATGAGMATVASATLLAACGRDGRQSGASTTGPDGAVRLDVDGLEVGQSRVYPSARVVVSRPEETSYVVFDQKCPHQGCAVSEVEDGQLVCPCHASYFDATTGDVLRGPATTGLTVLPSALEGSEIVLRG